MKEKKYRVVMEGITESDDIIIEHDLTLKEVDKDKVIEKIKSISENNIEYWKKENERLKEVIEKQNKKLDKITNAVINNCRSQKKIINEVWDIVMGRK